MNPATLAKSNTEHAHQVALFAWAAVAEHNGLEVANAWAAGMPLADAKALHTCYPIDDLAWFHAIPNGGTRGDDVKSRQIRGAALKAEGVRTGVSDCFLPAKRGNFSGLYIEMKKPDAKAVKETSKGGVSDSQRSFGEYVKTQGFGFVVCYSWLEAVEVLTKYLNWR